MRKLPVAEIVVALLVLAAGLGVFAYAHRDEGELEESKLRGMRIVAALESYREANGEYPDSLAQLVPAHLAVVAPPAWGKQQWRYRRLPGDGTGKMFFQLSVAKQSSGYPALYYDVTGGRFILNN